MISSNAQIRIVSFDTYRESSSLKDSTRIARKKRSIPPRHFSICLETDIERVSMSELLASSTTKKSLTELLMPLFTKKQLEGEKPTIYFFAIPRPFDDDLIKISSKMNNFRDLLQIIELGLT